MPIPYKDRNLIGAKLGRLKILAFTERDAKGKLSARVKCDCGKVKVVGMEQLLKGTTVACGCRRGKTHGLSKTREYCIWKGMMARCESPESTSYPRYGGRGIKICDYWKRFVGFYSDMGPAAKGLTLDRIDNDGNYEPSNCRWATPLQQAINKRGCDHATSRFKGVHLNRGRGKWVVAIHLNGKCTYLGSFDDETEAARAYDAAALRLFGPDAYFNFPAQQHGNLKKGVGNVGVRDEALNRLFERGA